MTVPRELSERFVAYLFHVRDIAGDKERGWWPVLAFVELRLARLIALCGGSAGGPFGVFAIGALLTDFAVALVKHGLPEAAFPVHLLGGRDCCRFAFFLGFVVRKVACRRSLPSTHRGREMN